MHVIEAAIRAHPECFNELLDLLTGLRASIFDESNHVTAIPDPELPDRYSAPFDRAAFFFKLEEGSVVVRCLQITFWDDFVPN